MVKPSELIKRFNLLQHQGFSKKLGQNFILDPNILDKIVEYAGDLTQSQVIEIGSGVGSLSHQIMLRNPKSFIILEKDPHCIEAVKSWLDVDIRERDALDVDYQSLLEPNSIVIANLPYSVATEILMKLCLVKDRIKTMVLMFQKEVGERITATPNTKAFGRLAIMAQTCFDCRMVKIFPPSIFVPAPKVDSALVLFTPKTNLNVDLEALGKVTHTLFSKRRKMLRQSFDENFLLAQGIKSTDRPEDLSVTDFYKLIKQG